MPRKGDGTTQSVKAAPYWLVITEMDDEDAYATAAVDAPTKSDARAEGERVIASQEETDAFEVLRVRGPFPKNPGEAAPEVRPNGCHGCGLHLWDGESPLCPRSTWFTRDGKSGDDVIWKCIQCGTRTVLPMEMMANA